MSDILVNGNGHRLPSKKGSDLITRDAATEIAIQVTEHYVAQMPKLVQELMRAIVPGMVAEMLEAHGITVKAPASAPDKRTDESTDSRYTVGDGLGSGADA